MPKKYKQKISRKVAVKKLNAFMERVEYWNQNYARFFRFKDIVLLGSLARSEDKVGDIDICYKLERVGDEPIHESTDDYSEWRKRELGYAVPTNFFDLLTTFQSDLRRFAKNRDGRFEVMGWEQFEMISLNLEPFTYLMCDGVRKCGDVEELIENAKPITLCKALSLVASNVPPSPLHISGHELEEHFAFISCYPRAVLEAVLERDFKAVK
ncbi:hypothetical protein [Enterovibrio calviensis]|uniref:hypothetical protein n=1 Tax=Enterovibrio calviensis TaxID=91359 RepID=UPI00373691D3